MIEDELLKWKFKRGSRDALARIYEKYVSQLLSLAMGLLNDPQEAEDAVQEVFVSFARDTNRFGLQGSLKAYLATSVVNRVRDRRRQKKSRQRCLDGYDKAQPESQDSYMSLVYSERCEHLTHILAELPDVQREAVVLRLKHDMTLKEIGRIQGVSLSTVHGRYRYGLAKLRSLLNGEV